MKKVIDGIPCKNCVECILFEEALSCVKLKEVEDGFIIISCELQNYWQGEDFKNDKNGYSS